MTRAWHQGAGGEAAGDNRWKGWAAFVMLASAGCRFGFDPIDPANADAADAAADGTLGDADAAADGPLGCAPLPCGGAAPFTVCGRCFATCAELVDRATATMRCTQWGGTLATIRSLAEDTCVTGLAVTDVWIGFEQPAGAATPSAGWRWVDGAPFTFVGWRTFEPNDQDSLEDDDENCAQITSGGWNDKPCTALNNTACSR